VVGDEMSNLYQGAHYQSFQLPVKHTDPWTPKVGFCMVWFSKKKINSLSQAVAISVLELIPLAFISVAWESSFERD